MSKTVESPVARYAGTVTFVDPMLTAHGLAWEKALTEWRAAGEVTRSKADEIILPGIFACVEAWNIPVEGIEVVDAAHFPASPRRETSLLVRWLIETISAIYLGSGEVQDPNG